MFKKIALCAVVALSVSSAALAGGLPVPITAAPADDSGVYLGGSIGYLDSGWKDFSVGGRHRRDGVDVSKDAQFGYRAFLGYAINKFFAVEGGWTFWNGERRRARIVVDDFMKLYVRTQAVDVVLKGKMPLTDDFSLFAKVGPAYMMSNVKSSVRGNLFTVKENRDNFCATFGAGIDYSITPNIIVNAEWLHYLGSPKFDDNYAPAANAYLVGIRYKFTDMF